uniref:Uncharacterized protein n=1 Tax=Panagrolaimus superbus TaxID=310955 RepID=A0A914Y3A3_9BILA
MVLVGIAAIIIIVAFVYYLFKKRKSAKLAPLTDATKAVTTVSNVKVATLESSSKRKHDISKFEPVKNSKKIQKKNKKTTQEPLKEPIKDAPAPHVNLPPTQTPAPPNPPSYIPNAKIPRISQRSLKSEASKKDKLAMVESAPLSLHHHSIKPENSDLLDEKENYPEVVHDALQSKEEAYCQEPKYFINTDGILTDSEVEKKEADDGKIKKKKSSKKRH